MSGQPTEELWPKTPPVPFGLHHEQPGPDLLVSAFPVLRGQTLIGTVLTGETVTEAMLADWEKELEAKVRLLALRPGETPPEAGAPRVRFTHRGAQELAIAEVALPLPGNPGAGARAVLERGIDDVPGVPAGLARTARWLSLLALVAASAVLVWRHWGLR